jgi:hypothetical protein
MRRIIVAVCLAGLGVSSLIWAAPAPPPPEPLVKKLYKPVNFKGIDDPKVTLADVLGLLSRQYDITFDVNDRGFKLENVQDVEKTEVANPPIREMKGVRLAMVLHKILSRVPVQSGAVFLVRGDHLEITTGAFRDAEVWGDFRGPHLPLVNIDLDKVPLEQAARELADQAGFNILIDTRSAEQAKTPVSAKLRNMPLDSALRLLSNMADLRPIQLDNALFVTTTENAAALEARIDREKPGPLEDAEGTGNPARFRKGSGPGGPPPSNSAGGM